MRSALPKRVWNKCMEYKITKANGDVAWFKLVGGNVNPKEVSYTLGKILSLAVVIMYINIIFMFVFALEEGLSIQTE